MEEVESNVVGILKYLQILDEPLLPPKKHHYIIKAGDSRSTRTLVPHSTTPWVVGRFCPYLNQKWFDLNPLKGENAVHLVGLPSKALPRCPAPLLLCTVHHTIQLPFFLAEICME